jgi:Flp pilus assembly protein TadG
VLRRLFAVLSRFPARMPILAVRDRRGALAMTLVISMPTLIGLIGLGTEVGGWYVGKRHGQNAADGAAMAGALMLAGGSNSAAAKTAAREEATNNGFTTGGAVTVTANNPYSGNNSAVEVIIAQTQNPVFGGLFISGMTIRNRAVAKATGSGFACSLAVTNAGGPGDVSLQGSTSISMPNCDIAADGTDPSAISIQGSASLTAYTLTSSGGCSGCSGAGATLSRPASAYQPPTPDPYLPIQSITMPTFSGSSCLSLPTVSGTVSLTPWDTNGHKAYCGSGGGSNRTLTVSNGNTLNFAPGTYFFYNASLSFQGGTIQCPTCAAGGAGVTIIMTGSPANQIGSININGNATVTLNAPYTNSYNSAFNGVLFYTDYRAQPNNGSGCGSAPVSINGGANSVFTGAMYFPSVNACFAGNMTAGGASASTCSVLVAGSITFTGNSAMNVSGCNADGVSVPTPQTVALVE